ncbi:MAG: hypothetical protein RSF00_05710, partial [Oscillospiraceae bacterium]
SGFCRLRRQCAPTRPVTAAHHMLPCAGFYLYGLYGLFAVVFLQLVSSIIAGGGSAPPVWIGTNSW